jgi:hypothetical protein
MNFDWKHFALAHFVWVVGVVVALVAGHAWLTEHDARLLADQQVKISETRVKDLQEEIEAVNAAAKKQVQTITKIIHDAQTPAQVVQVIPQLTNAPLNARTLPDSSVQVGVDAIPLVTVLGQCKIDKVNLDACAASSATKDSIITEKDKEITALKKPKSFFARLGSTLKAVGIGIGIGAVLGAHL